jgi:hypothetical protein
MLRQLLFGIFVMYNSVVVILSMFYYITTNGAFVKRSWFSWTRVCGKSDVQIGVF